MDLDNNTITIGVIIALILEPLKLRPTLVNNKLLPIIACVLGVLISWFIVSPDNYTFKDVVFNGVAFGLNAIGGRSAVSAGSSLIKGVPPSTMDTN